MKAYTLGNPGSYDKIVGKQKVKKVGITEDYQGGFAFKTIASARKYKDRYAR